MKSSLPNALALALLTTSTLAGCPASSPILATQPQQTVVPASTATSAPGAMTPTAAPVAPVVTAAPNTYGDLKGTVKLAGKPFANANLRVEDAVNSSNIVVVAQGTTPPASGTYVDATSLTTDANGNFDIKIANIDSNGVLRVVATSNGQVLTGLISGTGKTTKQYVTLATADANNTNSFAIDETTLTLELISRGVLKMAHGLTEKASHDLIATLMASLNQLSVAISAAFAANPPAALTLANTTPSTTTTVVSPPGLSTILATVPGLQAGIDAAVSAAVVAVSVAATIPANVQDKAALTTVALAGTNISVTTASNGTTTVSNASTGGTTSVTSSGSTSNTSGTTSSGTTSSGSGGGGSGGFIAPQSTFNPSVGAILFHSLSQKLEMNVSQPFGGGETDIGSIFARIPVGGATIAGGAPAAHNAGGFADPIATSPSQAMITGNTLTLTAAASDGDATSAMPATAPGVFGGATLTNLKYDTYLKITSTTQKISTFQVYTPVTFSGVNYHVINLGFVPNSADAPSHFGNTTKLTTSAFTSVTAGTVVDVFFTSRSGQILQTSQTVTTVAN